MTTRSTFRTSLFSWKKANKPMCVVGFAVAGSKNFSQRNRLINKPKTSRHATCDKQVAHRNEANGNSESNVCASTPRFHYDVGTATFPTGSDTRKITMTRDRLIVFLHVTGNCKMAPRQDAQKPGNASLSRWTTKQFCENQARAIPNHTSKPLPSRLSQLPRRPRSPPRYVRDRGTARWCWPCNASQQRPHNAADTCTHAATQRCTSVVKSLPTENAM